MPVTADIAGIYPETLQITICRYIHYTFSQEKPLRLRMPEKSGVLNRGFLFEKFELIQ
jgi:hypothetical protein